MKINYVYFIIILLISLLYEGCKTSGIKKEELFSRMNNKIKTIKYYKNNLLDSSTVYFDNKLLEKIIYFKTETIKEYSFYCITGDKCYSRRYNSDGSLLSCNGEPCFFGTYKDPLDTTKIFTDKDTIITFFLAPTLPKCFTKFSIIIEDSLFPNIYKMSDVSCGYYTIKDPYKAGTWENCFAMEFYDSITNYQTRKNKCVYFEIAETK